MPPTGGDRQGPARLPRRVHGDGDCRLGRRVHRGRRAGLHPEHRSGRHADGAHDVQPRSVHPHGGAGVRLRHVYGGTPRERGGRVPHLRERYGRHAHGQGWVPGRRSRRRWAPTVTRTQPTRRMRTRRGSRAWCSRRTRRARSRRRSSGASRRICDGVYNWPMYYGMEGWVIYWPAARLPRVVLLRHEGILGDRARASTSETRSPTRLARLGDLRQHDEHGERPLQRVVVVRQMQIQQMIMARPMTDPTSWAGAYSGS